MDAQALQDYGVDSHLETTEIAHGWTRGLETAEITSPVQKRIGIGAFGWSKATNGELSGSVVLLNIKNPSDLNQYKGRLKGLMVMLGKPVDISKKEANPENAMTRSFRVPVEYPTRMAAFADTGRSSA